jgi:hypothetical protein
LHVGAKRKLDSVIRKAVEYTLEQLGVCVEFHFKNIDSTKFEEFCYDLLFTFSPARLVWRKGTALASSPSDQGRDIEASFIKKDIDGTDFLERWFIECKHYEKGVPPEKLQGALSWATAERPDVLLIIVSGFLSNACKQYLSTYENNNKPAFRIIIWEQKKLETLTSGNGELRQKYGLTTDVQFLRYINNYHAEYSLKSNYNSVGYLISEMDKLNDDIRHEVFYMSFTELIKPRSRNPINQNESMNDCLLDTVDYESYRSKLLHTDDLPLMYVYHTVSHALGMFFSLSDITNIPTVESNLDQMLKDDELKNSERLTNYLKEHRQSVAAQTKKRYESYNHLCNTFVKNLLAESSVLK